MLFRSDNEEAKNYESRKLTITVVPAAITKPFKSDGYTLSKWLDTNEEVADLTKYPELSEVEMIGEGAFKGLPNLKIDTFNMDNCFCGSCFISLESLVYFISGFFLITPSPEQGASTRTLSAFPVMLSSSLSPSHVWGFTIFIPNLLASFSIMDNFRL